MCYTIFILEHQLLLQSQSYVFFLEYSATSILAFTCAFLFALILSLVFVPAVPGTLCIPGSGWLTLSRNILAS